LIVVLSAAAAEHLRTGVIASLIAMNACKVLYFVENLDVDEGCRAAVDCTRW
jgi:hypothetical protein